MTPSWLKERSQVANELLIHYLPCLLARALAASFPQRRDTPAVELISKSLSALLRRDLRARGATIRLTHFSYIMDGCGSSF